MRKGGIGGGETDSVSVEASERCRVDKRRRGHGEAERTEIGRGNGGMRRR